MAKLKLKQPVGFTDEKFQEHLKEYLDSGSEFFSFLVEKNRMYGASSMEAGLIGNWSKLKDKIDRYRTLIENFYNEDHSSFEGIEDTLKDLLGYSLLGLYIYKNWESQPKSEERFTHGFDPEKDGAE